VKNLKQKTLSLFSLFLLLSSFAAEGNSPPSHTGKTISFDEAYRLALNYSLQRQISAEQVEIQREQLSQAKGSLLPAVSLRMRHFRQDSLQGQSFADNDQTSTALNFSQPLLRGLREYTALGIAEDSVLRAELGERLEQRQILFQLARVYYSLLIDMADLKNTQELYKLTRERVVDLKERVNIGRSRKSESLLAQSQLVTVESRQKTLERNLKILWTEFFLLTGINHELELIKPPQMDKMQELGAYLARMEQLPEIQRAKLELKISDQQVQLQKRYHYPDLTFDGNFYLQRDGVQRERDWDMSINLNFPLFEGFNVQSRVREAVLSRNQSTHAMLNIQRQLESEIRELYSLIDLDLSRLDVTKRAVDLARQNYQEQRREYNLGLVTNQEVLQALNSFIENQQVFDRLQLESAYNFQILKAKVGELQ